MTTPEVSIEDQVEAFKAWKSGIQVQIWHKQLHEWRDIINMTERCCIERGDIIRRKPAPKLRPWRAEEVPVGALMRTHAYPENQSIILGRRPTGVLCLYNTGGALPNVSLRSFDDVLEEREHSADNGKTWLPCGVEETP